MSDWFSSPRSSSAGRNGAYEGDPRLAEISGALRTRSRRAAFLCYHSVADDGPPFPSLTPETFERHLAALRRTRYQAGGHPELTALAEGARPRRPLAFLTFDDGYLDTSRRRSRF